MRVGFGYDSHPFDGGRELVLAGVRIPGSPGLKGFSDGDAVAHAVIDAVLGAACVGDVGTHFPPGEERWRDADSMALLAQAVSLVHAAGYTVGNVDVTVICEAPKIAPIAERMRGELARRLQVDPSSVSVKGKSNEGMGWIGRKEGLAVHVVALLTSAA